MRRTAFLNPKVCIVALLVGFCAFACIQASAGELVVALSPKADREALPFVRDGQFALQELEAARVSLGGGPPEPVVPSHCQGLSLGDSLEGAPGRAGQPTRTRRSPDARRATRSSQNHGAWDWATASDAARTRNRRGIT